MHTASINKRIPVPNWVELRGKCQGCHNSATSKMELSDNSQWQGYSVFLRQKWRGATSLPWWHYLKAPIHAGCQGATPFIEPVELTLKEQSHDSLLKAATIIAALLKQKIMEV